MSTTTATTTTATTDKQQQQLLLLQKNKKSDTLTREDVLLLLQELGGSATDTELRSKAKERFTNKTVKIYLRKRINKLLKWQLISVEYDRKRHCVFYVLNKQAAS